MHLSHKIITGKIFYETKVSYLEKYDIFQTFVQIENTPSFTSSTWAIILHLKLLYQRPGALNVLQRILTDLWTVLLWIEISEVVPHLSECSEDH